jgi:alpha-galactosidase
MWVKPLADGGVAVGLVNLGAAATSGVIRAEDLHLAHAPGKARDLWSHTDVPFTEGAYTATIPSHGVLLLRVASK